jgi:triacylglycerol esterase/lipase EstA (alpha/beta hydrolase family)
LVEEAQEVKASLKVSKNGKDSLYVGQVALDTIRRNPDLYRQLASRYILIGHSMGGVVAREYVQGNFYNGDVDKIITLDSPHEGTSALNMQVCLLFFVVKYAEKVLRRTEYEESVEKV